MTQTILTLTLLIALAAVYVLSQHGWGNTLLSIGMWFYDAGTRFNNRSEARRKEVVARWQRRLMEAE